MTSVPTVPGLSEVQLSVGDGVRLQGVEDAGPLRVLTFSVAADSTFSVEVETGLGAAAGLWHPDARGRRTLPADWAGSYPSSLVQSAPALVLYDADSNAVFSLAVGDVVAEVGIVGGVSEEHKTLRLRVEQRAAGERRDVTMAVGQQPASLADAVRALGAWLTGLIDDARTTVPTAAAEPVYSTWYTYTQDVDEAKVAAEAALAATAECRSVFIDDGWQQHAHGRGYAGCGDWVADEDKFPDLRGLTTRLRRDGQRVVLWVAPLLLGPKSAAHATMAPYAPHEQARLSCRVLDPRFAEVRAFVVATCLRLVEDYGVDGLKIDFLNDAMVYAGTPSSGDVDDVGQAMRRLLAELTAGLRATGHGDALIEFRQPYVSPAIAAYANCLRAADCPADSVVNRQSTVDLRLFVRGAAVHADPLMWGPGGGAAAVAQQMLNAFFAVPQVSMRLGGLDGVQLAALRHHLDLWTRWKDVALFAPLQVAGAELGYTSVGAVAGGRAVMAAYEPVVLDVPDANEVLVLNATADARMVVRATTSFTVAETHGPAGEKADGSGTSVPSGLHELAVPAWGTALLRRS